MDKSLSCHGCSLRSDTVLMTGCVTSDNYHTGVIDAACECDTVLMTGLVSSDNYLTVIVLVGELLGFGCRAVWCRRCRSCSTRWTATRLLR